MGKRVAGVQFEPAGAIINASVPEAVELVCGDRCIVDMGPFEDLAEVVLEPRECCGRSPADRHPARIVRLMVRDDVATLIDNERREWEGFDFARERIEARGLPMKLVRCRYTLDGKRTYFYYTAEGRIDFRALVRDLARRLRTRIEMRQIGPRDEAKMVGALGCCGLPTCCSTFVRTFRPVSMKLARLQHLGNSPVELTGHCQRLKCCLAFEAETYENEAAALPPVGSDVRLAEGRGRVVRHLCGQGRIVVELLADGTRLKATPDEVTVLSGT